MKWEPVGVVFAPGATKQLTINGAFPARKSGVRSAARRCCARVPIITNCSRKNRRRNNRKCQTNPEKKLPEHYTARHERLNRTLFSEPVYYVTNKRCKKIFTEFYLTNTYL
jgi:hypothetical protein